MGSGSSLSSSRRTREIWPNESRSFVPHSNLYLLGSSFRTNSTGFDSISCWKHDYANFACELENNAKTDKILIVGTASSGKTTIAKQFEMQQQNEVDDDYRASKYKHVISENIVLGLHQLFLEGLSLSMPEIIRSEKTFRHFFQKIQDVSNFTYNGCTQPRLWQPVDVDSAGTGEVKYVFDLCNYMWKIGGIQRVLFRKNDFTFFEINLEYFMAEENFNRIASPAYIPSKRDIIEAYKRTTGIHSTEIMFRNSVKATVLDAGGYRVERKRWSTHFDKVSLIVYVVALSDYNCRCQEDTKKNRLVDSLETFERLLQYPYQGDVTFLLLFNKADIFRQKIDRDYFDLKCCFPEYDGKLEYRACAAFIKNKFLEVYQKQRLSKILLPGNQTAASSETANTANGSRLTYHTNTLYSFRTIATDTEKAARIFKSCEKIILDKYKARKKQSSQN